MKKLTPQQQAVIDYLQRHECLTSMSGLTELNQVSVRNRIGELIKMGYPIKKKMVSKKSNGKSIHYMEYRYDFEDRGDA